MKANVNKPAMSAKQTITLSSGMWGWVLTMFIVGIRIVQPNALPIEQWSPLSWAYMTLPITWPWVLYLLSWFLYGIGMLLVSAIEWLVALLNRKS